MKNKSFHNAVRTSGVLACVLGAIALAGCSGFLPTSGPSGKEVMKVSEGVPNPGIQIVEVTGAVANRLLANQQKNLFSDVFATLGPPEYVIGAGDILEVSVWEAPPGTLFSSMVIDTSAAAAPSTARGTLIPEQMVSSDGTITVPFAGQIPAAGHTLRQIEATVSKRLQGIAHQPQVLVRLVRNTTSNVTVVGEVAASTRMPLTPRGERLLDAVASAGGSKQAVNKTMIQVTRGDQVHSLPLDTIIRDPRQNIPMQPGDVVTALYQPNSFTVLGAMGKNDEVNFEAQGISLVQALGRAGGLQDSRADVQGVFIFRFEPLNALDWPMRPVRATPDGKVPVIYRANLKDAGTFFAAQSFQVMDKDLLYVSNAPAAELQKFLNLVLSVAYPAMTAISIVSP
ncbi:MAG: polysaccharide biosynthesis/export family protein [Syntrophobacteraceae bacterium]|nr:polysaccharide export protein [Desulfobacteraceae bacterium]